MSRLIAYEYLTLDGIMEAPETWQFPYFSDDFAEFNKAQILSFDASLLGRKTYETFAAFWPSQTHNEFGLADKINSTPRFVFSTTLEKVEWQNSTLIKENAAQAITQIKHQVTGEIGISGSATLVQSLMQHGLIDEYRLCVHPVLVGTGKRLFKDGQPLTGLKLVDSKTFSSGIICLTYQPAQPK